MLLINSYIRLKYKIIKMKTRMCLGFLFVIINFALEAQTTIVLQPDSAQGKDAYISDWYPGNYQNLNFGSSIEFDGIAWTSNGIGYVSRSLIDFSLSSVPSTATIINAKLTLYHNPNSSQSGSLHQSLSGPNDSRIERITSSWNEFTVTWNSQPITTTQNAAYFPQSTSGTQDYLNMDVTGLVQDIFANQSTSFGMMLRLNNENYYRSLVFCSTDCPDQSKHPKLEITYIDSVSCLTLQPDSEDGKDAYISDWPTGNYANLNFGTYPDYDGIAWTEGGVAYAGRGLLQFDLTGIPSNATIVSAQLSLYNNPASQQSGGQHQSLTGSNDGMLERITSTWDEDSVTWNTQPITTNLNLVFLPQSISPNQDYLNINVLPLVLDMINNPSTSFGFMIRLNTEQFYRSLVFASSDHADPAKHPKLQICYTTPNGISENSGNNFYFLLQPNPFSENLMLNYKSNHSTELSITIYDITGRALEKINKLYAAIGSHSLNLEKYFSGKPAGVFMLELKAGEKNYFKKIIKSN
jgi:hypothetical protein